MKRWRLRLEHVVLALLIAWGAGIAVAAVRLDAWQQELSRTLMQLRADALFRANLARDQDKIQPGWYRQKALSLISAMERMDHDTTWTLFMPSSWRMFDDLEERLSGHIGEAFGQTVVDTIHRELYARAGALTGVPQDRATALLQAGRSCSPPAAPAARRARSGGGAPEDLPEYEALMQYLAQTQLLDQAVQALLRLQSPATARPEDLQLLVRYALQAELPGDASRSVALFRSLVGRDGRTAQDLATRIQSAVRCSLTAGVASLHTRLLTGNELLSLETELGRASAGLFDPAQRAPASPEAVLVRYHEVASLLQRQEAVLARGGHEWMQQETLQLGPGFQALVQRVGAIGLLGPQAAAQAQADTDRAFMQYRQRFKAVFGGPGSGIVWLPGERRFALSPERRALRDGFSFLLREPYMAVPAGPGPAAPVRTASTVVATTMAPAPDVADVQDLAEARRRFAREALPLFPPQVRRPLARVVHARITHVAQERAMRAEDSLRNLPLFSAPSADFTWWNGEAGPLLRVFQMPDGEALRRFVPEQVARLEGLARQAEQLLSGPAVSADAAAQRWAPVQDQLRRYRERQADSSLVALENYLAGVGADLRRENCLERLIVQPSPQQPRDEIGRRHMQMHRSLVARCLQLRQVATPQL